MKTLSATRILDFYDGPLVVEAEDKDGDRYLCDSLGTTEKGRRFIVVPISPRQIDVLNNGKSCMMRTMERAGRDEWYLSVPQWDFSEPFTIQRQSGPISESPNLPGEGYMLTGAWDDEQGAAG